MRQVIEWMRNSGAEYQELKASFIIKKFNIDRDTSIMDVMYVNDMWISYGTLYFNPIRISVPSGIHGDLNKLIGRRVDIYCRIREKSINHKICRRCILPEQDFQFNTFCTTDPDVKYFIHIN